MRWMLALALGLALAGRSIADTASDEAEVRNLDAAYVKAFLASDVARFRAILADDFTCVLADGRLLDRKRFLQMAAQPPNVSDFRNDEVAVRLWGGAALVQGRAIYRRADGTAVATRYTDICVRRPEGWRMASSQFTRV